MPRSVARDAVAVDVYDSVSMSQIGGRSCQLLNWAFLVSAFGGSELLLRPINQIQYTKLRVRRNSVIDDLTA